MKLSKIIKFEHKGNWYRVQRDLVTYKKVGSFLPVPKENIIVSVSDKKDSPVWAGLRAESEDVSNLESLKYMLHVFVYGINQKIEHLLKKKHLQDKEQ